MTAYHYATTLLNMKICQQADMQGSSTDEIDSLERMAGRALPNAYREFLGTMGHGAGEFLASYDIFANQVPGLRDAAIQLLKDVGSSYILPDDAFVFAMHQGYEVNFFRCSEGDDPPVYQYVEGSDDPTPVWPTFSAFLLDQMEQQVAAAHWLNDKDG